MRKNHLSARMSLVALFLVVTALATADSISSAGRAGIGAPQVITVQKTVYAVGRGPDGIAFDGANIWVANRRSDTLTKLRASDGTTLGTFATGAGPSRIAYDGANIWVTNFFDKSVTKLRASDGANVGTFPVGSGPYGVAFDGANIWVTNNTPGTVTRY